MAISITKPTVGGSEDSWGTTINTALDTVVNAVNGTSGTVEPNLTEGSWKISNTAVTTSAADINIIDGLAASGVSFAEIGHLNGVTSAIQTQIDAANTAISGISSTFYVVDTSGDTTPINAGQYWQFLGGGGITVDWTDLSGGTVSNPKDMTISIAADQRKADTVDVKTGNMAEYLEFDAGDTAIYGRISGARKLKLDSAGALHIADNIIGYSTTVSDQRLKNNIQKIDNALDKVSQISGYTFSYNDSNKDGAGVIAQEIENVLPSAVENRKLAFHGEEAREYKTVEYDQIIGLLVEAVKELKEEIKELKNDATS